MRWSSVPAALLATLVGTAQAEDHASDLKSISVCIRGIEVVLDFLSRVTNAIGLDSCGRIVFNRSVRGIRGPLIGRVKVTCDDQRTF